MFKKNNSSSYWNNFQLNRRLCMFLAHYKTFFNSGWDVLPTKTIPVRNNDSLCLSIPFRFSSHMSLPVLLLKSLQFFFSLSKRSSSFSLSFEPFSMLSINFAFFLKTFFLHLKIHRTMVVISRELFENLKISRAQLPKWRPVPNARRRLFFSLLWS